MILVAADSSVLIYEGCSGSYSHSLCCSFVFVCLFFSQISVYSIYIDIYMYVYIYNGIHILMVILMFNATPYCIGV